jgi:hypothetical protein
MVRCTLTTLFMVAIACALAYGAQTGALVGLDEDFWGASIGQVDNGAQAAAPFGVFTGALDMGTVNGWLATGGVHSFALIPPAPNYWGNGYLPLAGVPDVGVQEMTLTLSDWSQVTVPLTNASFIKRGVQGDPPETYYGDMNFHDHESPDCIPVNGGPRPVLYQVDLSAYQGQTLAVDTQLDLRGNGWSEEGRTFDVYEVTKAYDHTTVTYASLVYDGDVPPISYEATCVKDQLIKDNDDTPYDQADEPPGPGLDGKICTAGCYAENQALIFGFDTSAYEGMTAVGDGALRMVYIWCEQSPPGSGETNPIGIYELLGDPDWDETTVTGVNFCPDGDVSNAFGELCSAEAPTAWGHQVFTEHTIPQASLQKLLDGDIVGLALTNAPGLPLNDCPFTKDAELWYEGAPTLIFDATEAAPSIPGDANGDGAVTDADYTIWADNYGATGATVAMGDFTGDGEVSDADYTVWADNYGAGTGMVPEPGAMAMLSLGAAALLRRRMSTRS